VAVAALSLQDEARARATISSLGYISTTVPPWNLQHSNGRLTVWPSDMPAVRQNLAIKC
jgi:hypothetical protein